MSGPYGAAASESFCLNYSGRDSVMAMMRYNFLSEVLSLSVDVTITYPTGHCTYNSDPSAKADIVMDRREKTPYRSGMKFQTVYMLHGGSDDDTTILRNTRLEQYAQRNCVMTVSAQVKDSFYMDTRYGFRYFTFITEELPCVMQSLFASSPVREDNFVVGMAMGGNGALALYLRRPELYAACVDLSGGIGCSVDTEYLIQELSQLDIARLKNAFPPAGEIEGSVYDLKAFARRHKQAGTDMPELFMAVGENDFIRDVVRKDKDALKMLGYDFLYEEAPGCGHDWDFWDAYIQKAFDLWLPLKRVPVYPE